MTQCKTTLSVVAAIAFAEVAPALWAVFREADTQKGNWASRGGRGALESFFSPLFWMLAISSFTVFFISSRSGTQAVRVVFFWIPTVIIS